MSQQSRRRSSPSAARLRLVYGQRQLPTERPRGLLRYVKALGPGLMAGLADNDPSGVATYAIAGATAGFSQLWLLVLATFMVQAVQVSSAKLGDVAHQGILETTRRRYGRGLAYTVALVILLANEATLVADVAALGAAIQLLTGLPWQWFTLPGAVVLLLGTIFFNYDWLRNIFMGLGLLLLAYVVSAFLARPDWGAALHATVIPTLPTTLPAVAAAVALLGTTVSPYLIVWQAEGEREAHRSRRQFRLAVFDVTVGYVASNLVSYFIIVTTAATLFVQHRSIATAADAAAALRPVAGDLASTIFAIGLLGAAVLAIPMFPISIGYTIGGALNWPCGLSAPFHEARGFYVIVALAFLSGGAAAFLGIDPIQALFYSQILNGLFMPFMIVILFLLTNDRRVMGDDRNGRYYNVWLVLSALIMAAAAVWLVAGLV